VLYCTSKCKWEPGASVVNYLSTSKGSVENLGFVLFDAAQYIFVDLDLRAPSLRCIIPIPRPGRIAVMTMKLETGDVFVDDYRFILFASSRRSLYSTGLIKVPGFGKTD
jgi:hypothetical protein